MNFLDRPYTLGELDIIDIANEEINKQKKLIRELSLALKVCDAANKAGLQWKQDSPVQQKIDELVAAAGSITE